MKTIIALFGIATLACSAYAQAQKASGVKPQGSKIQSTKIHKEPELKRVDDMIIMRSGKMMLFENGKVFPLAIEMTMKNGTIVKPDGTLRMKDGTTKMMQSGDRIDLDGHLTEVRKPVMQPQQPREKEEEKK